MGQTLKRNSKAKKKDQPFPFPNPPRSAAPEKFSLGDCNLNKIIITRQREEITCLCILNEGRIAYCCSNKIKIIDLSPLNSEILLVGHQKKINSLSLTKEGQLISSSSDSTIKIWKVQKDNCKNITTLLGHKGCVNQSIQLQDNKIVSCSADKTIKIWENNSTFGCSRTLLGHSSSVNSIVEIKEKGLLVSYDKEAIRFWDMKSYKCKKILTSLKNCSGNITLIDKDRITIIGEKGALNVISLLTFQLMTVVQFKPCFGLSEIYSVVYSGNGTILVQFVGKLYEIETGEFKVRNIKSGIDGLSKLYMFKNILLGYSLNKISLWGY